jgi:hypothetical protein
MKYVILIHQNEASRAAWEGFSETKQAEGYRAYAELDERLAASGELVLSEALADPSLTKRIAVGEDGVVTSDGPFAEAKELLAGIYVVECASLERAIEIAGEIPGAGMLSVEVRPVLSAGGMEM